mgnify:CR=1 FL=1
MKPFLKQFVLGTCVMFTIFMTLSCRRPTTTPASRAQTRKAHHHAHPARRLHRLLFLAGLLVQRPHPQKAAYPLRLTGFAVTSAGMLFACGWFGNWFPHEIEVVASFFITFLAIFALAAVGYGIYFKKTAGSYDAALARYREQNRR